MEITEKKKEKRVTQKVHLGREQQFDHGLYTITFSEQLEEYFQCNAWNVINDIGPSWFGCTFFDAPKGRRAFYGNTDMNLIHIINYGRHICIFKKREMEPQEKKMWEMYLKPTEEQKRNAQLNEELEHHHRVVIFKALLQYHVQQQEMEGNDARMGYLNAVKDWQQLCCTQYFSW
jgi:hypothetical protein